MSLSELFVYIILSLSVSFMWSFADIFAPIRNFVAKIPYVRKPLLCPECSSFWMGLLVSIIYNPLYSSLHILSFFMGGLVVHLFACFLYKIYFKLNG